MELEEKKKIIEEILKYPTGNISDAMDNLGIRRGAVIGLHAIDPKQEKAAGFALTIRQARRSTAYDGKNQARQGGIIDTETKPYARDRYGRNSECQHRRCAPCSAGKNARSFRRTDERLPERCGRDRRTWISGILRGNMPGKECAGYRDSRR